MNTITRTFVLSKQTFNNSPTMSSQLLDFQLNIVLEHHTNNTKQIQFQIPNKKEQNYRGLK